MKTTLKIAGMHCAGCSSNLEKMLKKQKGVTAAAVDLAAATAVVDHDPALASLADLCQVVENCGFDVVK